MCLVNNWHSSRCVCVCVCVLRSVRGIRMMTVAATHRLRAPSVGRACQTSPALRTWCRKWRGDCVNVEPRPKTTHRWVHLHWVGARPSVWLFIRYVGGESIFIIIIASSNTHTHPFNGPLSRTTQVSRYQKGKTSLDFTDARDIEFQWHHLGKSAFSADR